ncbi:molybdopterin biosynthesis protein [Pseudobacteroides cellulosolvens]|uniref:Molybdopterin molybdenumtransferase n=1 Tax=Pseudobacteroides cellulosolvens ATCC 35603 = DSM 2933 TaxID=398512 RepID=A0A0L6JRL7_9FIRM|nr:molybdopterin biosynthesis protein [Pseudobacteroides cellulosolvens]KNY28409.1 PBP domain containing protein [Pseudobacteroides cellulosolvens ATCC 35603 = DSM 2933]
MSFSYLNNIELDKALQLYIEEIEKSCVFWGSEEIFVKDSFGRITSEAVYALISSPHYNACAMDGIALKASSTYGATDTTPVHLIEEADFKRVDTGDPLPNEFDSVVMIEDVIELGNGSIKLVNASSPWQNVRQIGEDVCANEMIVPSNTLIEPYIVGAFLAGGVLKVKVRKKPLVGLIPTGDEIINPKSDPGPGEIIEFNSSIFSGMLENWGAIPRVYDIIPDKLESISQAIKSAASECNIIIVNAGSSAGREDFTAKAVESVGKLLVHGIAIRPGKPTILGIVNGKPVIGVPGYPVSGIIVMDQILKKVLEIYRGISYPSNETVNAVLSKKVVSSLKYKEFVRMKTGFVDGKMVATPLNRGAGVITSMVKADGIMEIPLNQEGIESGKEVKIRLLKDHEEIKNTIMVVGSHDPLIDVITDIMRKRDYGMYLSSAHVGSIGGIMAIKKGEAHAAGIHLLDEETGEYNISYLKRYFPNEKVNLIKGVKRIQGLMTAPGNPKHINGIVDLKKDGISFVNRQKGAGTRILLDFLLKQKGIEKEDIEGYDREEYTHMSIAALVAAKNADVGLGIYSAAKIYGLDFIPVCQEEYDFIIPERFMEMKHVKTFLDILKSHEFKRILTEMEGYRIENAGRVYTL